MARFIPLWAFAVLLGLVSGAIVMLAAIMIGLQLELAAIADAAVCCTAVSLVAFVEAAAEILMAVLKSIFSDFGAILAMIAALFSGFF